MENKVLNRAEVLNKGVNYDELFGEYCSDRILDASEEEGGIPFTGLVYELYNNTQIRYYAYYENGFEEGDYVEFHIDGKIKKKQFMKHGQVFGVSEEWYSNGQKKSIGNSSNGIRLSYKEWDENGIVTGQKEIPTESEQKIINKVESIKYE